MKQPVFYLRDERVRDNLIDYIRKLPVNDALPLVVKFSEADRTLAQNDLFHALCGDTAKQLQWAGKSRDLASWKVLYVSGHAIATGKPGEVVPGLEGEFCAIRESTAKMGIRRMTSLIEYSQAFAVQNGVPTTLMALKMDSRTGQVYSFWLSTPADSAAAHDPESLPKEAALRAFADQAGLTSLLHLNGWTLASCALVLLAAWLLLRHWQWLDGSRGRAAVRLPAPVLGLWALLYAVWAGLALVVKDLGVLALLFSVALATGRRRSVVLAVLVLLAHLSGFYYALQWPLERKAALLAGLGACMALALGGMHAWVMRIHPLRKGAASLPRPSRWWLVQRAALAFGVLLVLGLTQRDVMQKETVIAQGQRIYIPLRPRDPRSIMQGDYMALNFSLPVESSSVQNDAAAQSSLGKRYAVARLDARGVATLQRLAVKDETLTGDELLVPLKYLKGEWTVVTDAYFFPEGQGRVFNAARFGEFRALGRGKVLLVGLADEKLQRIEPRPDAWGQDGGMPQEERLAPQIGQ